MWRAGCSDPFSCHAIQCTGNLKHRTFLMTLDAAGRRFAEAANAGLAGTTVRGTRLLLAATWFLILLQPAESE